MILAQSPTSAVTLRSEAKDAERKKRHIENVIYSVNHCKLYDWREIIFFIFV